MSRHQIGSVSSMNTAHSSPALFPHQQPQCHPGSGCVQWPRYPQYSRPTPFPQQPGCSQRYPQLPQGSIPQFPQYPQSHPQLQRVQNLVQLRFQCPPTDSGAVVRHGSSEYLYSSRQTVTGSVQHQTHTAFPPCDPRGPSGIFQPPQSSAGPSQSFQQVPVSRQVHQYALVSNQSGQQSFSPFPNQPSSFSFQSQYNSVSRENYSSTLNQSELSYRPPQLHPQCITSASNQCRPVFNQQQQPIPVTTQRHHERSAPSQAFSQSPVSTNPCGQGLPSTPKSLQKLVTVQSFQQTAVSAQPRLPGSFCAQPQQSSPVVAQSPQRHSSFPHPGLVQGIHQGVVSSPVSGSSFASCRSSPACSETLLINGPSGIQASFSHHSIDHKFQESLNPKHNIQTTPEILNQPGILASPAASNYVLHGTCKFDGGLRSVNEGIRPSLSGVCSTVPNVPLKEGLPHTVGDFSCGQGFPQQQPSPRLLPQNLQQQQQQHCQQLQLQHHLPQPSTNLQNEQPQGQTSKVQRGQCSDQQRPNKQKANQLPRPQGSETAKLAARQGNGEHPRCTGRSRSGEVNGIKTKGGERTQKGAEKEKGDRTSATKQDGDLDTPKSGLTEKEKLVDEMKQSTSERFPRLRRETYSVPPIRNNKTKYQRLKALSTNRHDVMEQQELQYATLLGDQTEDTIFRCLAEVVSNMDKPMFILSNYQFDDYLFFLDHKSSCSTGVNTTAPKPKEKNVAKESRDSDTGVSDSSNVPVWKSKSKTLSECSTDSSQSDALPSPTGVEGEVTETHSGNFVESQRGVEEVENQTSVIEAPCAYEEEESSKVDSPSLSVHQMQSLQTDGSGYTGPFPTPRDLESSFRRGDFDNLIISPWLGFIVIEAKTLLGFEPNIPQVKHTHSRFSPEDKANSSLEHEQDLKLLTGGKDGLVKTRTCHNMHTGETEDQSAAENGLRELDADDQLQTVKENSDTNQSETGTFHSEFSSRAEQGPELEQGCPGHQKEDLEKLNNKPESQNKHLLHSLEFPPNGCSSEPKLDSDSAVQNDFDRHVQSPCTSDHESTISSGTRDGNEEDFRKTIMKSLSQLRKAGTVLRHLTRDLPGLPVITKVLALPNTSSGQLRQLLEDPALRQECCDVLGTRTVEEALVQCLTSEQVTENEQTEVTNGSPADATEDATMRLTLWWAALEERVLSRRQRNTHLHPETGVDDEEGEETTMEISWDVYEQIISRFCGPFSRLKTRTVAECIHLTGVDFGRSILRQEQLQLLDSSCSFMCLTGPPGSGKTLILALKAAKWAKQGDQVVVICVEGVNWGSLISWTLHKRVVNHLKEYKLEELRRQAFTNSSEAAAKAFTRGKSWKHKQKKPKSCQPSTSQTAGKDSMQPADSNGSVHSNAECNDVSACADLVKKVIVTRETNVEELVALMLKEYQGGNLRVIVDERPRFVTEESTYDHLSGAWTDLKEMKKVYSDLRDRISDESLEDEQRPEPASGSIMREGVLNLEKRQHHPQQAGAPSSRSSSADVMSSDTKTLEAVCEESASDADTHADSPRNHDVTSTQPSSFCTVNQPFTASCTGPESPSAAFLPRNKMETENMISEKSQAGKTTLLEHVESSAVEVPERETIPYNLMLQNAVSQKNLISQTPERDARSCNPGAQTPEPKRIDEEASSSAHSCQGDHFSTMEERMKCLDKRFSLMQPKESGGPDIMRSDKWRCQLKELYKVFCEVRELMTDVASRLPGSAAVCSGFVDSLEKLSGLMVSTMGHMYLAYVALTFFQVDQFFAALRREASPESRSSTPRPNQVSVWSASSYSNYIPEGYERGDLTHSIRCPPSVQRILKWTEAAVENFPGHFYITRGCDVSPPLPSDGPPVTWLNHSHHSQSDVEINDCAKCGHALADYLFSTLGLKSMEKGRGKPGKGQGQQSQLYFHDVIICGSPIHQPECAFIQAMRQRGLDFVIENQELQTPPPYINKVFVIGGANVQGIEAKIIVFVPELKRITNEEKAVSSGMQQGPPPDISSETVAVDNGDTSNAAKPNCDPLFEGGKGEKYSRSELQERERLRRLGKWNREYIWHVASRCLSHLVVFHNEYD